MSGTHAVIFDLGKVLVDFDYSLVVRRVGNRSTASLEALERLIVNSPLLPAYERGELTSTAFYDAVRKESGFRGGFDEFAGYFADIFTEIPAMTAVQAELRSRGIPTFIFSNTNDIAIDHIRRNFPFFARFDGYVLSYEHGCMKPDAPLYEVVERMAGRRGADLVYLDDRAENIAAGRDRGWHAILHHDPAESRQRLQAMGLLGG